MMRTVCQETLAHHILVVCKHKWDIPIIQTGYSTMTTHTAPQIKPMPDVGLTTKSTEKNINKLKVYLSNETKTRRHIK